jgi:L-ascorbate metabolism protein UlaG (beta-lactamase superfamily)
MSDSGKTGCTNDKCLLPYSIVSVAALNSRERDEYSLVSVIWHGHACFELQGKGVTIVTDPFKGIGIPEPKSAADIVLCSHSHQDHNNVKPVSGKEGQVLEGFAGSKKVKGVPIRGVAAFHDEATGSKRGKNSIYTFNLEGVQFCHLGDLGHDLSSETVKEIGNVDVVFVPVGGHFTIGPETATKVCEKLKPKIIIPMHYRMPGLHSMFDLLNTVDDFLKGKKNIERTKEHVVKIEQGKLPRETNIIVLSPE